MEQNSGSGACDEPSKRCTTAPRFGEPLKFLPIIFVACTICGLWSIYIIFHCIPLLQIGTVAKFVDQDMRRRGTIELVVLNIITPMLLICYVLSIVVHPGIIPDNDPHWEYQPYDLRGMSRPAPLISQETKKSGDRRHCKWCGKYKPDRTHHCRVCKTCILKMDHHCPWIYNCVGYFNYKFFFLLLFYSMLDCHLIFWSMLESVNRIFMETPPDFTTMFFIFFGETLAFFLGVLVTMFFGFHIWLMLKALTTIEFCEKSVPKKESDIRAHDFSLYDLGCYNNIRVVLGQNPLLWLVPCMRPAGDGLNFMFDETTLTLNMEDGRVMRKKTHQKTQRPRSPGYGSFRGVYGGGPYQQFYR